MVTRAGLLLTLVAAALGACRAGGGDPTPSEEWFVDAAADTGLAFTHINGMTGRYLLSEIMAPGVALFDYDNDGDLDVYLVQGDTLPAGPAPPQPEPRPAGLSDRLYRNDLRVSADGTRALAFTDVTATSGIEPRGYGMGVAVGDVNNDGWADLYLTKFEAPNQLFVNRGDGTFRDASAESGTALRGWSVSAAFADVNRDGWLDLFVAGYLRYTGEGSTACVGASGASGYCTPDGYPPLADRLFLNRGDGTFSDHSLAAGITGEYGPGLGVATADYDGDGWVDIYVANDGMENQLWRNRHDGTFENVAPLAGAALPVTGKPEASMGVDAGDFDDDGDDDLFMTELNGEGSNLFVNDGAGVFDDRSGPSGLGPGSLGFTGFGTGWIDVDLDGSLDVLSANGTVQVIERLRQAGDLFPLRQPMLLFRNEGGGRFRDVSAAAGAAFARADVGRGVAFGDVDNDGDTDVVVAVNNGPVRLLANRVGDGRHWVGLRLVGEGGRDMLGARVEMQLEGGGARWRRARSDGSYASASDPRVVVGLGESVSPPRVRVVWPDGRAEVWERVPVDRYTTLRQGAGP